MSEKKNKRIGVGVVVAAIAVVCAGVWAAFSLLKVTPEGGEFEFIVVSDVEAALKPKFDSADYFPGLCKAIRRAGKGAFLVATGDISPPDQLDRMIRRDLGDDYPWYFVVGNHDVDSENLAWLKAKADTLPGVVRRGPKNAEQTTYSFDYGDTHFVVLNEYYSGLSDAEEWSDICPSLYDWVEKDLRENTRKRVFVFGHEPFASIPDAENGIITHETTNLSRHRKNATRFWRLLGEHGVIAYVCGHTDTFSWAKLNGVWQVNCAHSRGMRQIDTSSTFLKFVVRDEMVQVRVYRSDRKGGSYVRDRTITLD